MIEIAASAGVPFTPDPDVMRDDEVAQVEKMLIDFKQAGITTNVTDATQPVILSVPPSGGIPPAAPPRCEVWMEYYGWTGKSLTYPTLSQRDHLIIAIRENLLLQKKSDCLRRDVEELKRQQLLKAFGTKIRTILKSAICHSDVAVLMCLILMFCVVTTSAQYLPTAEKKVVRKIHRRRLDRTC
ncbi:unnamed protein product [Cylicocyclus nassatus]|uniref:Uncharacterized protein n=1 Tax=Cylicocyclus nassatus TaxID=53992 RepID=A0AA36GLQ4_CYLNA|nr:unnamed protein product [Cylicocyclus nassatus]